MNGLDFLDAVGSIDARYIEEAEKNGNSRRIWKAAFSAAACLAILIGAFLVYPHLFSKTASVPIPSPDGTIEREPEPESIPPQPILKPGDEGYVDPGPEPIRGIEIPAIELPEVEDGVEMDMMGLVVYRGGIYTQNRWYSGQDAEVVAPLVGEHLGNASGSISVWSTQDEYTREFASTVEGEVYTVNGYDPGFRLCIRNEYTDETGKTEQEIVFMDRLNGITLVTGYDLFETRLRMRGRIESILWQSHEDWNEAKQILHDADLEPSVWEAFLDALDQGLFIDAWTPDAPFYEDHPKSTIYTNPNQAHLILYMDDGTEIPLRLIEGGYVSYAGTVSWYFVKMPGEVFDAVYDACGGTHDTDW